MEHHILETTDLFKGAFLLCKGGNVDDIRIGYTGRKTAIFTISGSDVTDQLDDYENGKALVNPAHLRSELNYLKDLMFNKLRKEERKDYANNRTEQNRCHQNQR